MKRWLKISAPVLAILLLFGISFSCKIQQRPDHNPNAVSNDYLNLAPEVKYVGDEECAVCHSEIFKTYKQTGMGRSFYLPTAGNRLEDYAQNNHVFEPKSNLHYQMISKGDEFYQVEYRLDEKGQRTHELARKVDYVIGSGHQARTYLTSENGFLYELPVTWYHKRNMWGMSPGFQYVNSRFSRPIAPACMNCHNSYAEHAPYSGNRYTKVAHGIGCERCHGPGELHVKKRYATKFSDTTKKEIDSTIVNPRRLPVDLQMDVCRQCHLSGEVRVLKDGKNETDFRPGMRLREIFSVYIPDRLAPGDLRVASHGERISLSSCYVKSGGKLVCITCHNPHQPVKWLSRDSFNNKCLTCHRLETLSRINPRAKHQATDDCVACHMPQGGTTDVLHVNFTDHWIRKEPQTPVPNHHESEPLVLKDFFEEKDAVASLRLGIAYLQYFEAIAMDQHVLEQALLHLTSGLENNSAHEQGLFHLGKTYVHLNRLDEARQQFQKVIKIAPGNAFAHFQLGQVLSKMGQPAAAATAYQVALKIFPENAVALTNLGTIHAQLGNLPAAFVTFQKAVLAQPSYAPAHNNIGEFYAYKRQGLAIAQKHFRRALELEPDYLTALNNLGNVDMASGNYAEAMKFFTRVIAVDPKFVPAYGNLALIHSLNGRNAEAVQCLRRILALEPNDVNAKNMLKQIESAGGQASQKH